MTFSFSAQVWLYPGKAGWCFVTLPTELAAVLDHRYSHVKGGWGSLPVTVTCRDITWGTSIFPDKKSQSYVLPLKAAVRKQAKIVVGDTVEFSLVVRD